ncbi:MAG: valine--tRNA ligase [Bacillota bacterium]|nr:valine--tRNA ligase [Bacillota bacterium]
MGDTQLSMRYNPADVEDKWYRYWIEKGYFHAEVDKSNTPFSMVIPPPNVTGHLHLGHALDETLQDILVRWHRMQGHNTVWIPGTDHAGIATQVKVEEHLRETMGVSRHDLGREEFLKHVWEWKERFGNRIIGQLQRLGSSCDWDRERFTMDEGCSRAVREVFVRLFEKGLIYKGTRIINWCPRCQTALSDIEVEYSDTAGRLHYVKYPLEDGSGYITVATTRPETILGDTAVAVNPADERYKDLVGKTAILPVMNRRIPIIADEYVDPEFGTGAVKITPAHDPNDFEVGLRHNLEQITVIGPDGRMTDEAGPMAGMDRYECRKSILAELDKLGLLVKLEDHQHSVGHCQRCDSVVEPYLSEQWFVKMKPLAEPALKAVQDGRIRFVPERFAKIYTNWLEGIHDWCISRQLWWGHRIPVWYCRDCSEMTVARQDPTECSHCGSVDIFQDPDVLDTWFSSALWPFSTMGWPDQTEELEHWYPTSVLVTGYDIIFFWVARMVFMGLEFMNDVPFRTVFIHGLLRDGEGRKMSKSLGNSVDPIEVIDEVGADSLRFTLVTGNAPGNDMRFYDERVEASRNFANKIWNASRFALMNLGDYDPGSVTSLADLALETEDRWILSRLNNAISEVTRFLTRFDLGEAARVIYEFIWGELCDWYIEMVKPRLYGKRGDESRRVAQATLSHVLEHTMRLLHPFMPFITEEIWQRLPHEGESIVIAPWPVVDESQRDLEVESEVGVLMDLVRAVRNVRAEMNVEPARRVPAILQGDSQRCAIVERDQDLLKVLAGISDLEIRPGETSEPDNAAAAIVPGLQIYLPLVGLVDIAKETQRLESELAKLDAEIEMFDRKLANEGFVKKAPAEVVERERQRRRDSVEKREAVVKRLEQLRSL